MNDENTALNDLNSVLLEGTVVKDPVLSHDQKGVPRCILFITSERYLKQENGIEKRTIATHINTKGKLAEQCVKLCRRGRKIRAVGSLQLLRGKDKEGRDTEQMVIDAVHIETKPEMTAKREKEPSRESYER
jgi:single-strand DNA-binding protein